MNNPLSAPAPLADDLRSRWLLAPGVAFLNHGSFGAVTRAVFDAQTQWRRRIEAEPVETLGRRCNDLVAAAKRPLGAWLNMRDEDFGFVTNATEGVNAVLRSLCLSPGDELLATSHVYNAVRQAMRHAADLAGAAYREFDVPLPVVGPEQVAEAVLAALSPNTRLLVIDHVTSPTALVFPVEPIVAGCAARGVDVLVDGAHAPGMLPLDVPAVGAAYYTGNLHKWPCAPKGCAFLWARPDRQAGLHPLVVSHPFGEGFAREFAWQGTRDYSAWLSVPAALEFMADLGWEKVMAYNHALAVWAQRMFCARWGVEPVSPADGRMIGSMFTVPLPPPLDRQDGRRGSRRDGQAEESGGSLQQWLYDEGRIEVPVVGWAGRTYLRPCCQVYNVAADYQRLAEVIESECGRC